MSIDLELSPKQKRPQPQGAREAGIMGSERQGPLGLLLRQSRSSGRAFVMASLSHLALTVSDVERSIPFYRAQHAGGSVAFQARGRSRRASPPASSSAAPTAPTASHGNDAPCATGLGLGAVGAVSGWDGADTPGSFDAGKARRPPASFWILPSTAVDVFVQAPSGPRT